MKNKIEGNSGFFTGKIKNKVIMNLTYSKVNESVVSESTEELIEASLNICHLCKKEIGVDEVISLDLNKKESCHVACADMESLKRKKMKELEMASRIIRGK